MVLIRISRGLSRVPQLGSSGVGKDSCGSFAFLSSLSSSSIGARQHVECVSHVFDNRASDRGVACRIAGQERVVTKIVDVPRYAFRTPEDVVNGFRREDVGALGAGDQQTRSDIAVRF